LHPIHPIHPTPYTPYTPYTLYTLYTLHPIHPTPYTPHDQVAAQVCSSTEDSTLSTSRFLELGAALLAHKDKGLKPNNIQTEGVFFDLAGVAQVVLFTLMAGAEYRFLHQPHLNRAGEEEHEQAVKRELSDFLLRKYPITAILVFRCVYV
ncbi:hypothetical protein B484DRAFT_35080, partial [Ochromonadaceae sp. CCMP2298]